MDGPGPHAPMAPGLQGVTALCEVTGGGEKIYGIAVEYDRAIDPASLATDTFAAGVFPAAKGYFPGLPQTVDRNATDAAARPRSVIAIYTNGEAALRADRRSVAGRFVILAFAHDADLRLPTTDSDSHKIIVTQNKPVRTAAGAINAASAKG